MKMTKQVMAFVAMATLSSIASADFDMSNVWNFSTPDEQVYLLQRENLRQQKVNGMLNGNSGSGNVSPLSSGEGALVGDGGPISIGNLNVVNNNLNVQGNDNSLTTGVESDQSNHHSDQTAQGTTLNGDVTGSNSINHN